jgi:DUF4097 and DUF4098 domain-containing protein YvlB
MRKYGMIVPALLAMLWLLTGLTAQAAETVDESGSASPDGRVIVENIAGSITVIGWNKNEIHVEGTLGDDVEELRFKTGKKKSIIKVVYPRNIREINEGADLTIRVPEGSELSVECISADVVVSKLTGDVELSSISGVVEFTGWCQELEAEAISGNITIDGGADRMSLEAISGDVQASGREAAIEVDSVSGNVILEYDKFMDLSAESVSGSIKVIGDLSSKGRFNCDVVTGTITLIVPRDVNAEFQVSTFDGSIDNEFGQKARRTSKYAPGKELEFVVGDGEAAVELNSFSGDIRIKIQ